MFTKHNVNAVMHPKLGWTIGHALAVSGDWKQVQSLMALGLDANKGDKFGWTPRQLSEDIHGVDIFQGKQCPSHPLPELKRDWGMTHAHIAAINGRHAPILECIIKDANSFYVKDAFGNTALDYLETLHHDNHTYEYFIHLCQEMDDWNKKS